jgi:hypothetical protein
MLMMKFIGKPYAGKPHVRFDEGAGKVVFPLPALLYRGIIFCFPQIALIFADQKLILLEMQICYIVGTQRLTQRVMKDFPDSSMKWIKRIG